MIVKTTDKSRGIRLGNFPQIRSVIDERTRSRVGGQEVPKEALDSAVARGNDLLARFEKTVKD